MLMTPEEIFEQFPELKSIFDELVGSYADGRGRIGHDEEDAHRSGRHVAIGVTAVVEGTLDRARRYTSSHAG